MLSGSPARTPTTSRAAPWSGGGGHYAVPDVLAAVRGATTTIIFINTRAQAELFFQALWAANEDNLPIGLHHGSLSREARQKVEAAMAAGALRAVVATGSLDLGIDWGGVDLVIQVELETPTKLTGRQKELLEEFRGNESAHEACPKSKGFFDRLKGAWDELTE